MRDSWRPTPPCPGPPGPGPPIIRRQSQTIRDLVNDLNLTMRLDCQMQALRKTKLDLAPFLRQTAADFLNSGLAEGFSLALDLPDQPCPAWKPMSFSFAGPQQPAHQLRPAQPPGGCHPPGGPGRQARLPGSGWKTPPPMPPAPPLYRGGRWPSPRNRVKIVAQIAAAHGGQATFFQGETFLCQLRLPMRPS